MSKKKYPWAKAEVVGMSNIGLLTEAILKGEIKMPIVDEETKPQVNRKWINSWIGYWHDVHGVDVPRASTAMESILDEAGVEVIDEE